MSVGTPKEPVEIVSPEGVEERVLMQYGFRVTLTGGGKYRIYAKGESEKDWRSLEIHSTIEEAKQALGRFVMFTGLLLTDPNEAMKTIVEAIKNKGL